MVRYIVSIVNDKDGLYRDTATGPELVKGKETVRCIVSIVNDRDGLYRDTATGAELVEGKEMVRCIVSIVNDRDPITPEVQCCTYSIVNYF